MMETAPGDTSRRGFGENGPTATAGPAGYGSGAVSDMVRGAPLQVLIIAGSVGYGLGWLTAMTRGTKREPLPDYARKRAY